MEDEPASISYGSPPIVLAVVEVRFADELSASSLKKASDWLVPRYVNYALEEQVEAQVDFSTRITKFIEIGGHHKFASSDLTQESSISKSNVTWSQRAPYEGWDHFYDRVALELRAISKAILPRPIARLGLRFINRIDIPPSRPDYFPYEDYFNFRIESNENLEPCTHFQWLITKTFPDEGLTAIVQSAILAPEIPGLVSVSLDIDLGAELDVPRRVDDILLKLVQMRHKKNEIFEAAVTAKAKERYA